MKAKFYLIAAAACAALAACSKNEVAPVDVDQEITYQAVVNKASTKAMISGTPYDTTNTFGSVAYLQVSGDPVYIPISEVTWTNNYWSTDTVYYWPKSAKLTFYSYSPYYYQEAAHSSNAIAFASTKDGLTLTGYSVKEHQETDLMVAEPQKDRTSANTTQNGGTWNEGVTTIFHHMLAQLKAITFQTVDGSGTAKDFTNGHSDGTWVAGDKQFIIDSVKILNFYETGDLTATTTNSWATSGTATSSYEYWTGTGYFGSSAYSTAPALGYYLLLPQDLTADGQKLNINYTIKTFNGSDWADETVDVTIDMEDIFTTKKWEMNKKYTINIKVSLDQIYWDPQVVDWVDVPVTAPTI